MTPPLVIGNWKMNLDFVEAVHLGQQIGVILKNRPAEHTEIVVVPPFVDLRSVTSIVDSERIAVEVGAQHVNPHENGAHTGEVSTSMLKRLGVTWVLVGHSERRAMYAMDDEVVAATLRAVVRSGLRAVLCVGEASTCARTGTRTSSCGAQLRSALDGLDERYAEQVTSPTSRSGRSAPGLTPTRAGARHDALHPFGPWPIVDSASARPLRRVGQRRERGVASSPRGAPTASWSGAPASRPSRSLPSFRPATTATL
jgi:hypothetical protein